jgi:hypothetical protein
VLKLKKLLVLVSTAALIVLAPLSANAQFGGLLSGAKSNSKTSADNSPLGGLLGGGGLFGDSKSNAGDVDAFLKTASEADGLIRQSSDALFKAVATKEELDAHADKMKAANEVADPKEKEAALKKAEDDQQAQLAKVDFAAKAVEAKTSMDAKQKAQTGTAIYNFTLGMLKDMELLERGQGVVSSISGNPMAITKVLKVKDVLSSLSSQMSNISTIAAGVQKMSSVVKLDALPTKSSDQPKAWDA